ncbi:ATP-binding protein [Streptomyces xantholiticus]
MNVQMPSRPSPASPSVSESAREGRRFTVPLSPTRRGARLARRLTVRQLADWRQPSEAAEHIVAELAANAVQHGRVPGRDFRLTLSLDTQGVLRIEVTDVRAERLPPMPATPASGRRGRPGERARPAHRGSSSVSAWAPCCPMT